eukprot:939769-Prymnesium_polylepis.1
MPICSRCEKERPNDCFTTKQLKAAASARRAHEAKTQLSSSTVNQAAANSQRSDANPCVLLNA